MAENSAQERTEEATPKRRLDSRKKGQVPRSKELNTLTSLLAAGVGMLIFGKQIISEINQMLVEGLSFGRDVAFSESLMPLRLADSAMGSVLMLLPLFALLVFTAIMSPFSLGGWVFNGTLLAPKSERVSLIKGFGRLFSPKSLLELFKALGKFVLVASTAGFVIYLVLDDILMLSRRPLAQSIGLAGELFIWCLLGFSSVLVLVAAMDVPFQLWDYKRKIRMTKQEVKDELKETDGRPEIKNAIKQRQQEIARQRMMSEVPTSDVVITNPTHFAVALRYDQTGSGAPKVVAKGQELVAARIREVAEQHGVPIFSAPPLARALYASTDLNQEIPRNLFLAVAQVLAYIFQLRRAKEGGGKRPIPPRNIPVSEEYSTNDSYQGKQ